MPCSSSINSIIEKAHTDPSALICTHYNHWDYRQGPFVEDLHFGSLRYQTDGLTLPVTVELIEKTEAVLGAKAQKTKARNTYTKHEYLRAMLHVAQQQATYRSCWPTGGTASAENLNAVRDQGHHFVMALESSRTVALSAAERAQGWFQAVDTLPFPDGQPLRV